jgi:hypothetical protein
VLKDPQTDFTFTFYTISQLYFDKDLYMFRTDLLSIIRSLNIVFYYIGRTYCILWNIFTILSFLYNVEYLLEHVLKFNNNVHVYTLVILPVSKISL